MQNALPGNSFCPVKVRIRGMFKCKKKWMQSSASQKDSLVESASQLYADVWLAHDLSHDRITLESKEVAIDSSHAIPRKKELFF